MSRLRFKFDKLIRDKVPQEFLTDKIRLEYEILTNDLFINALKNKLIEEIYEVVLAQFRIEIISELGDVYDVIDALIKVLKIQIHTQSITDEHRCIEFLYHNLLEVVNEIQSVDMIDRSIVVILAILETIAKINQISHDEIVEVRKTKNEKRGGFTCGIFAKYIEVDNNSDYDAVQYFKNQPEKYPIIT